MIRYIRTILASLVVIFTAIAPWCSSQAQTSATSIGDWTLYPVFSLPVTQVIETSNKVYFVAGGSLFSYDPSTEERRSLTVDNMLTDFDVNNIFYNPQGKYLAVTYTNGNIDLIYDNDDDKVVNLPDIKVATSITSSRKINDMAFEGDRVYAATDFGMVVFDMKRHEVVRSGILGVSMKGVTIVGDIMLVLFDNAVYKAEKDGMINKLDNFTRMASVSNGSKLWSIGNGIVAFHCTNKRLWTAKLKDDYSAFSKWNNLTETYPSISQAMMHTDSTIVFNSSGKKLYRLDRDLIVTGIADIPEQLSDNIFSLDKGPSRVWALDMKGLGLYDLSAGSTVKMEKFAPEQLSVKEVASIIPSADGERIYFMNLGPARMRLSEPTEGETVAQQTSVLENGRFKNIAPYPVEAHSTLGKYWQNKTVGKWITSPSRLVEDPDDPSTYYVATNVDGVYRVTDGKVTGHYDKDNSPLVGVWENSSRVFEVGIDPAGNLWLVSQMFRDGITEPNVMVLPAAKRRMDTDKITADDWIVIDTGDRGDRNPRLLFCKHSNMVFIAMKGLVAIDTKGTFNNFNDDKITVHTTFVDQDGKTFPYSAIISICEDHDGRIWVGTDKGIFEITTPTSATSSSMVVNHLKMPLNDGTNTAEYLLPTEYIYGISVDHANRKWVATRSSGIFLVSERGDKIIANYTADNSMLPDNMVHDIYADVHSNRVYVGTSQGLLAFNSDASPVKSDYSDIYAYPNPVRPDHTGPICIVGLMEGTMVKITDASGMLMAQVMSEGGMAQWDGCNLSGQRVKSGVYYVFASSGGGSQSTPSAGAVTKILVVN